MPENNYDAFAAAFQADNENNAWNAYYERPAILSMVGDVKGRRVLDAGCGLLSDGGRLVFSTHHPFMDHPSPGHDNYFETYPFNETWERDGRDIEMRFWHRPLHAMFDALKSAGFQIEVLSEPQPDPRARSLFPEAYLRLATQPRFLFFSAVAEKQPMMAAT